MPSHRLRAFSSALLTAFLFTSIAPAPVFALRQGEPVETTGLEEVDAALRSGEPGEGSGIGSLPRRHAVVRQFTDQFKSGRIPNGKEGDRLLKRPNVSHPLLSTQWIGVTTVAAGLVGTDGTEVFLLGSYAVKTLNNAGTLKFGFNLPNSYGLCSSATITELKIDHCEDSTSTTYPCP